MMKRIKGRKIIDKKNLKIEQSIWYTPYARLVLTLTPVGIGDKYYIHLSCLSLHRFALLVAV